MAQTGQMQFFGATSIHFRYAQKRGLNSAWPIRSGISQERKFVMQTEEGAVAPCQDDPIIGIHQGFPENCAREK